jgi:hypothetical protein
MRFRAPFAVFGCAALAAVSLFTLGRDAVAEEQLRWKFNVGEKLDYTMVQEMNMAASGAALGAAGQTTNMRQEMDMTWDVQGVNNEGEAVIKQKFDRVKMKMTGPNGGFEYDSKSEAAPTGLGALIAPMYKAMTQSEFEITMTARGEVKDVKVPEEVLTALKSSPGAAQMGDIATAEGFKKMISQGALVLPQDPPKEGDTWQTKVEMSNPAVGKQTVETTYRYEGTKDTEGTKYAVIKPDLKMNFDAGEAKVAPQLSMKIAEQSSDGEILFNIDKGRLYSTTLTQKVTIDATVAGQTIQQKIDQKIDVKVTPAGEKKAEDEAKKADGEEKKAEPSDEKAKAETK